MKSSRSQKANLDKSGTECSLSVLATASQTAPTARPTARRGGRDRRDDEGGEWGFHGTPHGTDPRSRKRGAPFDSLPVPKPGHCSPNGGRPIYDFPAWSPYSQS